MGVNRKRVEDGGESKKARLAKACAVEAFYKYSKAA